MTTVNRTGRPHPAGPRTSRRALDKAVRCLDKRSKISAGARTKILPFGRLGYFAAARGLVVMPDGLQRPIRFGELLAKYGPLGA